jgi:hypothetical protein
MSRFAESSYAIHFRTSQRNLRQLTLLVVASLSIPWSLACGAAAQGAETSNANVSGLRISGTLPAAMANQSYAALISVSGGRPPYQFSVNVGALPTGIQLDPQSGALTGKPASPGLYPFSIRVTDATRRVAGSAPYELTVLQHGGFGGIGVSLSPDTATVTANAKQQFQATVTGTANTAVTWSTNGGTLTAGLLVAPNVTQPTSITVTATSVADTTKNASALVTVTPVTSVQPLAIQTSSLASAEAGQPYDATLAASGGKPPYTWSMNGSLPTGLSLSSGGVLSGMTTSAGNFSFTAGVKDSASNKAQQNLTLSVSNSSGNFDGPAELPRVYVNSALADTPAPGKTIAVNAGGDLKAALNAANCGDTITLQAGAQFSGLFQLPAKPCDDQHWIIIRTSAPDSELPPEGQRLTPCYAGVASLPNRPAYPCPNPQNVMARITVSLGGISGPLILMNGANHYRLIGLEITRPPNIGPTIALVTSDQNSTADYLIIDRCWIHGTAHDDTRRGVQAQGMTQVAVVDSYLNDFHCTALTGACTDSQAVSSGGGLTPNGPYKITNNFLEASGENVFFAGSQAAYPPSDIEIRKNHFYKPLVWMPGQPGFVGGSKNNPFITKNHIEFKNGQRALIEGNIFENSWGGFSQAGYSILLTSRNNFDSITNVLDCPNCQVTDVTIRYNKISHVGNGFLIANLLVHGQGAFAGGRFSIHDVVVDDINDQRYNGGGALAVIGNGWPARVLNSISMTHITAFPGSKRAMLVMGNSQNNPQMWGFTFSNNVVAAGQFPIWSVGNYLNDCSASNIPIQTINLCWKNNSFTNNVLIAAPQPAFSPSKWPAGNFFPATDSAVGFSSFNNGIGGDYTLSSSSPYKGKASDGTDPGANIQQLEQEITGVE